MDGAEPAEAVVRELLEQVFDSRSTPEEACREHPELLSEVRRRWERMRTFEAQVERLFPTPDAEGQAVAASVTPSASGELLQIPGYLVESVLGRGGMGIVYRARHLRLGRHVALKMLLAGEFASREQLDRFRREAEVVAGLRHPGIVQVFDVGDHKDRPWFTMELIEGGSLAQDLDGKPQPAQRAASLVASLAQAMQVAHDRGIVHRDIKPANILLDAGGVARLSDFGLARRLEGESQLTLVGSPMGTPSYMAPEQALGKEGLVGPASDVYALGAVLYEMLTGRPPFQGETPAETERQVVTQEPVRPSRLNPRVPRDLETISLKCLEKDPQRRYASAADLAADLQRFLNGEPIAARPVGRVERVAKWVRRRPAQAAAVLGAAVIVVGVVGGLVWLGAQRAAAERAVEQELDEVARFERAEEWAAAGTALERAKARLGEGASVALAERVERAGRDLALVAHLDDIRLQSVAIVSGHFDALVNRQKADGNYAAALGEAGWARVGGDPAAVAARVAAADIRGALIPALDDWASCAYHSDLARRDWILDVVRRADPDPSGWRDRVRDPAVWSDRAALEELASTASAADASLLCQQALADRIRDAGGDEVPLLRSLQEQHPSDFWANFNLGFALREASPEQAVRYFQAALSVRPDDAVVHNNLGASLALSGRCDDGLVQLREALRLDPSLVLAQANIGNALTREHRLQEALDAYRSAATMDAHDASIPALMTGVLSDLGRVDEARQMAQRSMDIDPHSALPHAALGVAFLKVGSVDEAIAEDRRALELEPSRDDAQMNLALALIRKGRLDEAVTAARTVVDRRPRDAAAHSVLSEVLRESGRAQEAIEHGQEAVRLDPGNPMFRSNLAGALARAGRIEEAVAEMRESLRLDPANADARLNLGNMLGMQQKFDDAIEQFRECLRLAPNYAQAQGSLGQALFSLGRLTEAREPLARAVDLFPADAPPRAMCQEMLRLCDAAQTLKARLPDIVAGRDRPANAAECMQLVTLCRVDHRYALAARFSAEAFAAEPSLAEDLRASPRYDAACFAVLAGSAQDADADTVNEASRQYWREQARLWLRASLAQWTTVLEGGAVPVVAIRESVASWRTDPDLQSVRELDALKSLPSAEAKQWSALWSDVDALIARAQ